MSHHSETRAGRALSGAVLAAFALTACAADDVEQTAVGDDPAVEASADAGVFNTVSGGQIDGSSLEGTDTILWFWAPW